LLHIHGDADTTVRMDGKRGKAPGYVTGPPIATVVNGWRVRDHCKAFATTTSAGVTTSLASCPQTRTVEWLVIAGGGHEWPGSPSSKNPANLDATALIWAFFSSHPRP
jgi:polyhydroxybutyrate depolymerase